MNQESLKLSLNYNKYICALVRINLIDTHSIITYQFVRLLLFSNYI